MVGMTSIYIDADACPVKEQIYRTAARYGLDVFVVANSWMRVPDQPGVTFVQVDGGADVADDWIAESAGTDDIVATADLPLAGRALERGATAIDFRGKEFTPAAIGDLLASRAIAQQLRMLDVHTGGPRPLTPRDRGLFAGKLDEVVNRIRRQQRLREELPPR